MALRIQHDNNQSSSLCNIVIDEDMNIYVIDDMKQELSKMLDSYTQFKIDLAGIEEIDSAGVQLLLALRAELKRRKKEFRLTAVNDVVAKFLYRYGISELFTVGDAA